MMAGSDSIKTSTGKEPVNAILPYGLVMVRAIREYQERTGHAVGFKPAGGIRKAKQALDWLLMMKEELGVEWTHRALPARRERAADGHRAPARWYSSSLESGARKLAVVTGALAFGEPVRARVVLGGALVLAGVAVVTRSRRARAA